MLFDLAGENINNKFFFEILESAFSPVLVHSPEGQILFVNDEYLKLYKADKAEFQKLNIWDLYSPDNSIDLKDILQTIKKDHFWTGEIIENLRGITLKLAVKSKLISPEGTNERYVIRYAKNISIDNKLKDGERFKIAIQHSHEIIFMTDYDGVINYVNPEFEKFYGYSKEEIVGKTPRIIKSGMMSDTFYQNFWHKLRTGQNCDEEMVNQTRRGQYITVMASVSPFYDEANNITGFISIQRDITEQKRNEEITRRALDRAEESDNLKTAFLNQMSHEIRTPLNSILGFMSIMEEELVSKGNTHLIQYFASINRSAARLQRTIEDILSMSSIQIGNFYTSSTRINLEEVIRLLMEDFKSLAEEKNLDFVFYNKSRNSYVTADSYSIINSFQHLIDNALKFTNKGKVEITIYDQDENLCVAVKDTGIGISKEYMDKLFKPFTQEEVGYNRRYDGNGLGLALTKEYLRLNHAQIYVQSEKGTGTTFTVTFYRCD